MHKDHKRKATISKKDKRTKALIIDFRRANIFRRHQADLGLLLAALGAQQRPPKPLSN